MGMRRAGAPSAQEGDADIPSSGCPAQQCCPGWDEPLGAVVGAGEEPGGVLVPKQSRSLWVPGQGGSPRGLSRAGPMAALVVWNRGAAHAAGARAAIWQQHGQGVGCTAPAPTPVVGSGQRPMPVRSCCHPEARLMRDSGMAPGCRAPSQAVPLWPQLTRGSGSPGSPCSDTQRCQRPRAGDLLEAVGGTHPNEVFL